MIKSLSEWLSINKISYKQVDDDVIEIENFGKLFINDLNEVDSIFRKDNTGDVIFNLMETQETLFQEEIYFTCFQFGNNWYYYDLREKFSLNILKYVGKRTPIEHNEQFVNLGIHTPFELLQGSFQVSEWVKKAKYLGHTAIGICDKNTMAASLVLQKECKKAEIGYVIGYTLDMKDGDDLIPVKIYCQTNDGLQNLLRIQKEINVDSDTKTISYSRLIEYVPGNIVVFGTLSINWISENLSKIRNLEHCAKGIYYQVDLTEFKADRFDKAYLEAIKMYYNNLYYEIHPVLICDNYYLDKEDAKNKIILNKVADGAAHMQSEEQYFKDQDELYSVLDELFSDDWDKESLFEELCTNTIKIAEGAKAAYETDRNFMPQYDMTSDEIKKYGSRYNMFNQILEEGFKRLVPKGQEDLYRKRMEYEKYVIESTNNIDYFLVQYDTVNWATENNIMVGISRGSGGGCLLLYLMGITKLDPLKYNLIFERFLLPDRSGLYETDVTIIKDSVPTKEFVEIEMNGRKYKFDRDAQLIVNRGGEDIIIYADELIPGDDIIFDNRDVLWTINEL